MCHGSYSHGTFRLVAVNYPFSLSKNIDIVGFCFLSFFLLSLGMKTRVIIYIVFSLLSLEPTEWKDASLCVCAKCPKLCNPMDCSPPGPSVRGILQARILESVAMTSCKGSFQPRVEPTSLRLLQWQAGSLPLAPPRKQELGKWRFRCLFSYKESC